MAWTVELLDHRVQKELAEQPADIRARFVQIGRMLQENGPVEVGMPYVRHLQSDLWEMRLTGRDGIARAIYVSALEDRIVVVRIFTKKTQKTPHREIELAFRRAKEIQP